MSSAAAACSTRSTRRTHRVDAHVVLLQHQLKRRRSLVLRRAHLRSTAGTRVSMSERSPAQLAPSGRAEQGNSSHHHSAHLLAAQIGGRFDDIRPGKHRVARSCEDLGNDRHVDTIHSRRRNVLHLDNTRQTQMRSRDAGRRRRRNRSKPGNFQGRTQDTPNVARLDESSS